MTHVNILWNRGSCTYISDTGSRWRKSPLVCTHLS